MRSNLGGRGSGNPKDGGFTLIEIAVCLLVVALLYAFAYPKFLDAGTAATKMTGEAARKRIQMDWLRLTRDHERQVKADSPTLFEVVGGTAGTPAAPATLPAYVEFAWAPQLDLFAYWFGRIGGLRPKRLYTSCNVPAVDGDFYSYYTSNAPGQGISHLVSIDQTLSYGNWSTTAASPAVPGCSVKASQTNEFGAGFATVQTWTRWNDSAEMGGSLATTLDATTTQIVVAASWVRYSCKPHNDALPATYVLASAPGGDGLYSPTDGLRFTAYGGDLAGETGWSDNGRPWGAWWPRGGYDIVAGNAPNPAWVKPLTIAFCQNTGAPVAAGAEIDGYAKVASDGSGWCLGYDHLKVPAYKDADRTVPTTTGSDKALSIGPQVADAAHCAD